MEDVYAVQRTAKDEDKIRLGLFHEIENAKRVADQNYGYKVYDVRTKKLVYAPEINKAQALIGSLQYMDKIVRREISSGLVWRYSNGSLKKESTFAKARSTNHRAVNCVDGVQWGLKMVYKGISNGGCAWYGSYGDFRWLRHNSESIAKKYFNIIQLDMKVGKAMKLGLLKPGDICSYYGMSHTNCFLGDRFFDSGHANCTKSGEKAPFRCFISGTIYKGRKIGKILRPIVGIYRVQCGIFSSKLKAKSRLNQVKKAGFDVKLERDGKDYVVQAGLFDIEANAVALSKKIDEAGIPVLVKEI